MSGNDANPTPVAAGNPSSDTFLQNTLFPVTLKFQDVSYWVKVEGQAGFWRSQTPWSPTAEKLILNGLTGVVSPGEILAMLGPSGSGKTTLLTALGGRLPGKVGGSIAYNGRPFSGFMKRRIGFVTQDDVHHPHLTVFETLLFTALLRLPGTLSRAEKAAQAERVVEELGLARCRDTMVGGALVRGVSGGERKRVSIGQEMLVNPSLLLLDEPTSGLDSTTAQRIVSTVKRLARGGRAVVTTIHQPSSRLFHMFDKLVLLSEGNPVYYGAASAALEYFASVGFSASITVNPADHLLDLANGIGPETKGESAEGESMEAERRSVREALLEAYRNNISKGLQAEIRNRVTPTTEHRAKVTRGGGGGGCKCDGEAAAAEEERWCTSWWEQVKVVTERGVRARRFEALNKLRIFQVIAVAFIGGLLWWQTPPAHLPDRVALIFFFSVFWGFYPLYNAVFTFPQERRSLEKERASGMYRLSSYFVARTAADLPLELLLPTAFVFVLYWMGGLDPRPLPFLLSLLVVLLTVLVAQSLGAAIGAAMMTDLRQATTLASVTTLVFLIAAGYYIQHIPPFIAWLKYLSFSYYCYKLLIQVQYGPHDTYPCHGGAARRCRVWDYPSVRSVGAGGLWVDVAAMSLMLVGYRLLAYVLLRRQLRMRR